MKRYIYYRCSTDRQDYLQQEECIRRYFARSGLDFAGVDEIVREKASGTISYENRQLRGLLNRCESGDIVYVSELSRLGRNMSDLFALVSRSSDRGITLIQCKDGSQIESASIGGKALLFALSLAAEIEVGNIRQRTQMGLAARRKELEDNGSFISNSGRKCTHFGRAKGCDTSEGVAAARVAVIAARMSWAKNSKGFHWARQKKLEGMPRAEIVKKFNEFRELGAPGFATRSGGKLTEAILSKWLRTKELI